MRLPGDGTPRPRDEAPGSDDAWRRLCDDLERTLGGPSRSQILDGVLSSGGYTKAVKRLRAGMRSHSFKTSSGSISLAGPIKELDRRTRDEGFHVLQAWDYNEHRFTRDNLPMLMLDFWAAMGEGMRRERTSLAILLDNYFLHILALCAMRAWDLDDPDSALDRVTSLIRLLQGPDGSGQQFIANAMSALVLAVSHFHPSDVAYDRFVDRTRGLGPSHRLDFALVGAPVLGSHLRWGFSVMYERDIGRLRDDNVADYPWLLNAVRTLADEYDRMVGAGASASERENVVGALLSGLASDPWAFMEGPPAALADHGAEYDGLLDLLERHRAALLDEFEAHRPVRGLYSPLCFHTNFLPNTLVGLVMTALLQGEAWELSLDSLFMKGWAEPDFRGIVAKALSYYAGSSLDRLGEHGAGLIVYDVPAGMKHFSMTTETLSKLA